MNTLPIVLALLALNKAEANRRREEKGIEVAMFHKAWLIVFAFGALGTSMWEWFH